MLPRKALPQRVHPVTHPCCSATDPNRDVFADGEEVPSVDDDAVLKSGVEPPHSTGVKPPNTKAASSRRTPQASSRRI
ncbi:MAG TPA: hypothetical protein PLL06_06225 [Acidobacteriota bacterium]|nr:hypothetical protein [Acidobacteriota bacterium]